MHVLKLIELYTKKVNITICKCFKRIIFIEYYVPAAYHDSFILIFIITPQVR